MPRDNQVGNDRRYAQAVWGEAHRLLEQYQHRPGKADILLESLPDRIEATQRRRIQNLFIAAIRHAKWIEHVLKQYIKRPPKSRLRALLHLACAEMRMREGDNRAQVVDFAVEQAKRLCSKPEAAMVNAVLRKVMQEASEQSLAKLPMHLRYSHPQWLVNSWLESFTPQQVKARLEWNQSPPKITVRLFGELSGDPPEGLEMTEWEGFVSVAPGQWKVVEPLLKRGLAYVQDPSTRLPVRLLKPRRGERILDLCAAPGGKSVSIARALGHGGELIAVDLPGRAARLRENLNGQGVENAQVIEADVFELFALLESRQVNTAFDAVLIDAPCSNTGVLRRRPDAKWRLKPDDVTTMSELQSKLLVEAARFVKPGGRLVYSTCSVETAENEEVAEGFVSANGAFTLKSSETYFPEAANHDGGGAFLFEREG